ncbi:glycosyltransferase family 4 protein [Aurantimonas sp. A2-1-M11]|uniref:glycosyltransferase family 4 protein n=1 Tax=Aurantimonas sp. A2-1-M11 TaxID=3113712 RepID=UPI002F91DE1D
MESPDLTTPSPARPKVLFVITEDWFFVSHFLPMAEAAREAGFEPVVVTRVRNHAAAIAAVGARIVPLDAERREVGIVAVASALARMTTILRREKPAIVHCIALRSILVGGAAARLAGIHRRIYAVTGLGYLGARRDGTGRAIRFAIGLAIRRLLSGRRTRFLLENTGDAGFLGLPADTPRIVLVGGAGIDPAVYAAAPLPPAPPLKVAVVARMLWSKGIDTIVEAVRLARRRGVDVTLSLYGTPDPSNPRAFPAETLAAWSAEPFIQWHGRTEDVAAVWAAHHIACLPSRGGEGLPRTLLEAAACGRPLLTSDVPGCRDFVRDGQDGFVLPAGDPRAFAAALARFAAEPDLAARMGASARIRVENGYTIADLKRAVAGLYRDLSRTK